MKDADFQKMLKQSLHKQPELETETGLNRTAQLAKNQASQRCKRKRIPFRQFLTRQVRYIGWQLWGTQGVILLLFDRMLIQLYGEKFWDSPSSVARLLFCVSTLVAMMALPMMYRARKYRMQEIEGASYFSSSRLLIAKLAVIGIGDALLLGGMFLITAVRTSMEAGNLCFYLVLPFLTMSAAYLYMMGHCSGNGFLLGSITLGFGMLLLAVGLPGRWIALFQQSMTFGWLTFCGCLLAFSAEQLRYLLYHSPYAELQVI